MANPVLVECAADQWTKVATAVILGVVHFLDTAPRYLHTYRITGQAAPTDVAEGVSIEEGTAVIESTDEIDVYVYPVGAAGTVRVDQ